MILHCKAWISNQFHSLRKWKDKLKEWNYDKYLSKDEMKFIVTKQEKRKAEGKETIFVRGGQEISSDRIEGFKRRKVNEVENDASPDAGMSVASCGSV